jgi:YD repeat-containing protein
MGYNGVPNTTDFQYETTTDYGQQYSASHKGLLTGSIVAYNKNPNQIADPSIVVAGGNTATAIKSSSILYEKSTTVSIPGGINPEVEDLFHGYLCSVMYYDYKGQIIQSKSQNHLHGVEKEYIAYNFTGQPTKRKHVHSATGKETQTEVYKYDYDHAGRLTETRHELNDSGTEMILAHNTYDELGRLKSSKTNNSTSLNTTFGYNIRSWIMAITHSKFREELTYTPGGNIATMRWGSAATQMKTYYFTYDNLSRLTAASFGGSMATSNENYSTAYSYDKHGNIQTLQRRGLTNSIDLDHATGLNDNFEHYKEAEPSNFTKSLLNLSTYGLIDDLNLIYNGNQLKRVSDAGVDVLENPYDFKKNTNEQVSYEIEYEYNANGSMVKDRNKGITNIVYNHLNLPEQITINNSLVEGTNNYTYTATGAKLKVVHRWTPVTQDNAMRGTSIQQSPTPNTKTTDYVGNKIYENDDLKKILIANGYYDGENYYFYVRDHLEKERIQILLLHTTMI